MINLEALVLVGIRGKLTYVKLFNKKYVHLRD